MKQNSIVIKGAREHNLKNIDLTLPRDQFIVLTGLSGSGKSSLAFDTIYADGQRRYIESLSSYARQFLGQMEKPDVDSIEGLSPAISIDQKTTSKNPRSTVGTVTEIYDYLRLLYARIGIPHCPECGEEISMQTIDQIVDRVLALPEGSKIQILAPIVKGRKGEHLKELEATRRSGYVRVRIDGSIYDLSEEIHLEKNLRHTIDVVVDRLVVKPEIRSRLADSIETTVALTEGLVVVQLMEEGNAGRDLLFSMNYACPVHDFSMEELAPNMFSFNNPLGACPTCTGLGTFMRVDPDLIVPNKKLSIRQGAIVASGWSYTEGSIAQMYFDGIVNAEKYGLDLDLPFEKLPKKAQKAVLYGTGAKKLKLERKTVAGETRYEAPFEGIVNNLERRFRETQSPAMRDEITHVMQSVVCPDCHGERLKKEIRCVTVGGENISSLCGMSIDELRAFLGTVTLRDRETMIAQPVLAEISERLGFLSRVGLNYLTLSRSAGTLSGGESQRIRLATQIGSSLVGVLYILDEPSIGLHQRDNDRLIETLHHLRDLGNTLIVVEHDEDTMAAADHVVDIGPGAGIHGGTVIAQGTLEDIIACKESLTGQYLSGEKFIPVPETRRKGSGNYLVVEGATENNLKNVTAEIPLGTLTCVTGVSGSGKSSLVNEIIFKSLAKEITKSRVVPGAYKRLYGSEHLDKIIDINQSPIGRTPRSNPATYTGVFNDIRQLFSMLPGSKMRGYTPGRFSFNVKGGRCEACEGDGINRIEMHFLPDIYVPCEVCKGKRYNRETLEVQYKGKNISDVLEMSIEEGAAFFESNPSISRKLKTLCDVGLSYVKMGQSATTLSGGEAQRVKLASELSKRSTGRTMYILDEPTTGLHVADIHKLVEILERLVAGGNTVLVIEHNLDVIKVADHLIDLGPEGGTGGGEIIAVGTPEEVANNPASYTGQYLKKILSKKQER